MGKKNQGKDGLELLSYAVDLDFRYINSQGAIQFSWEKSLY